jgi:hypothetical protein
MKALLATILIIGGVALTSRPASADFPTCPPGYAFSPAYGVCAPYAYDPSDLDSYGQGYPFYPGLGYAPFFYGAYAPFFYGGGAPIFYGGGFGGFRGFAGHRFGGEHFAGRR